MRSLLLVLFAAHGSRDGRRSGFALFWRFHEDRILAMGIYINEGSSLERKWIVVNDPFFPMYIVEPAGIGVRYSKELNDYYL